MGSIFKPKIPPPPVIVQPPAPPPKVVEPVRKEKVEEEMETETKKRKGRRSTILTGPQGLTAIAEENLKKPLLGG